MKGETGERWKHLCEQAAVEQDSEKLLELTQEINRLLHEKEERLKTLRLKPDGNSSTPVTAETPKVATQVSKKF
jgi:hypothetical protein